MQPFEHIWAGRSEVKCRSRLISCMARGTSRHATRQQPDSVQSAQAVEPTKSPGRDPRIRTIVVDKSHRKSNTSAPTGAVDRHRNFR